MTPGQVVDADIDPAPAGTDREGEDVARILTGYDDRLNPLVFFPPSVIGCRQATYEAI